MLPPRHHKAAKKAFWAYWPRRMVNERSLGGILLALAALLMLASVLNPSFARTARMRVFDALEGVFATLSAPTLKATQLAEHISGLSDMAADLEALRDENTKLKQWYDRALQLEAENQSLRSLVNLADLPRIAYATARVIAASGSNFTQSVVVDAGSDHGVRENAVAMTGQGVVGRVTGIDASTAQIMLLTDVNTRIPVIIENSRHRGVLAGDNTGQPRLLYLPDDAAIASGERVLTSGHGGIFIPGLPVGVIAATGRETRIRPFADLRRLDFIQLVQFDRNRPVVSTEITRTASPPPAGTPAR